MVGFGSHIELHVLLVDQKVDLLRSYSLRVSVLVLAANLRTENVLCYAFFYFDHEILRKALHAEFVAAAINLEMRPLVNLLSADLAFELGFLA